MNSNQNNAGRQLKLGALLSYFGIGFNILAGLIYTPWMIGQIGQSDYGLYSLALSFISYFVMDFGLGSAISRFLSKSRATNDEEEIQNFLGLIYKLYLVIACVILTALIVFFFFIQTIFVQLTPQEIEKFRVIYIISGLFSVVSFPFIPLNGILISYEQFIPLKLCDMLNKVLTIVFMVVSLLLGYGLYALVIVNAVVGLICIVIKLYVIRKRVNLKINWKFWDGKLLKTVFSFSIWITIIGIAQQLLVNITPSVLAITSGTIAISVFTAGKTIQGYTWSFSNALNGMFMPSVSRMDANDDKEGIDRLMIKVGRIQLLIIGLIVTAFVVLGNNFILLWLGEGFQDAYWVAVLLILPSLVTVTQEIANTKLYVVNEVKYRATFFILASVLSVVISFLLSPKFGAVGSSVGIFLALVLCHVVAMNIVYHRVLKINVIRFFRECHAKMLIPQLVCVAFGLFLGWLFPRGSWLFLLLQGGLYVLFYAAVMWLAVLTKEEKKLFLQPFEVLLQMIRKRKG